MYLADIMDVYTSKYDMIYIGSGQYLKPWSETASMHDDMGRSFPYEGIFSTSVLLELAFFVILS